MSILLITGLPGAAKTLRALLEADCLGSEGHQVYVANVRGLKRDDWKVCDPKDWMCLPDGSVVLVDEVQDFFPMRSPSHAVPEAVQRLDKHRHRGFIFIFTCQYPKQIDFALRAFVDRHIHLRRTFGLPNSVAMELNRCIDIDDKGDLNKSMKTTFTYPKHVYDWYESASVHNMKVRIPAKVLAFPVLVIGFLGLCWFGYQQISGFGEKVSGVANPLNPKPLGSQVASGTVGGDQANPLAQGASVAAARDVSSFKAYQPRVDGLAFTASRYDDVSKPVRAPYPAACVYAAVAVREGARKGCKCYTQQGTPYPVSEGMCRDFAANGFFLDFEPDGRQGSGEPRERPQPRLSGGGGGGGGAAVFEAPAPVQQVASKFGGAGR